MECRDVRDLADSFLAEELLTETNHDVVHHLGGCPACREEFEARRGLKAAVRRGFEGASDLTPAAEYLARLRASLHASQSEPAPSRWAAARWWAMAAAAVLAITAGSLFVIHRAAVLELARAAVGDHRNCALVFNLAEAPIPLEEAARRYGAAYRVLERLPDDEVRTTAGLARVVARHSCVYRGRRFAHVVFEYSGTHVSLLVTERSGVSRLPVPGGLPASADGMSIVSFDTRGHAAFLTGAVGEAELRALAEAVATPLTEALDAESKA